MKFGLKNLDDCVGALLAHALSLEGRRLRKGHKLTAEDISLCHQAQLGQLVVAQLEPGDVAEDAAASYIADKLLLTQMRLGDSRTGRTNLYATADGLLTYDAAQLNKFNSIDEGITLALPPPYTAVRRDQICGTVKIIPFAVTEKKLTKCLAAASDIGLKLHRFERKSATLLQTTLPDTKASVCAKTTHVTRARLENLGASLTDAGVVAHTEQALSARLRDIDDDIILIVGASAICDRADIIPASICAAGGSITRFGMPVDPGNLLCLGQLGRAQVIGLPGCARSPKRNGFDLILERLCAGLNVSSDDIAAMGNGGLLDDVVERALPRAKLDKSPDKSGNPPHLRIGAILLAAGRSSRMGDQNKLLLPTPSGTLVRRAADTVRTAGIAEIIAVLGHQAEAVGAALQGSVTQMIYNADHSSGMASSIRAGLAAAPSNWDGAFILLGDMPLITPVSLQQMMQRFAPDEGHEVVVPMVQGQRANPLLWARAHWPGLMQLTGDNGGRALLAEATDVLCEVALDDLGMLKDVDDPASWQDVKTLL